MITNKDDKEYEFLDLFLLEAEDEEDFEDEEEDDLGNNPTNEPRPTGINIPNRDEIPEVNSSIPEDKMSSDLYKFDGKDLGIITEKSSRFFTFYTYKKIYENLIQLIEIQDRIFTHTSEKDVNQFKEVKERTLRFKNVFYNFLLIFNNYEQEELDKIKVTFESVVSKLIEETKKLIKSLNLDRTNL